MPLSISKHRPSWSRGFARNAAESENPGLWKGLQGAWMPPLGPTGLTLRDISGRHNHGTLTSMDPATDWVMTEKGWALNFDGSNDYVSILVGEMLCRPSLWKTLSIWFLSSGDATRVLMGNPGSYNTSLMTLYGYGLSVKSDATVHLTAGNNNADPYNNVYASFAANEWHHVATTVTGEGASETAKMYLDGILAAEWAGTIGYTSVYNDFYLAAGTQSGAQPGLYFPGSITNSCVYSRVLAPSEIQQLYEDPYALVRQRARVFPAAAVAGMTYRKQYILGGGIL